MHERGDDHELLLHPVREVLDPGIDPVVEAEVAEMLEGSRLRAGPLLPVEVRYELQQLAPRQLLVKVGPIGYIPNHRLTAQPTPDEIVAADRYAAGGREREAGQNADRGGLAGPIRAEKAEDLTGYGRERDVVDRREVIVLLGEIADLDHETAGRR